jgi:glycosyltransferase involved in cell wall biosynthesis
MEISGLIRIRNEGEIIGDTLDHLSTFCNRVFVFDDNSTDCTVEICRQHPIVEIVVCSTKYLYDRPSSETYDRRILLNLVSGIVPSRSWIFLMDSDERVEFNIEQLKAVPDHVNGIRMKLFDYYITHEDVNMRYSERRFLGPEYREILMAFRNVPGLVYNRPIQRSPNVPGKIKNFGYVKHYGKAISVEQWEKKCEYYSKHFPEKYSKKWEERKGKAIHTMSDFGRNLITWDEKKTKGIKLY